MAGNFGNCTMISGIFLQIFYCASAEMAKILLLLLLLLALNTLLG